VGGQAGGRLRFAGYYAVDRDQVLEARVGGGRAPFGDGHEAWRDRVQARYQAGDLGAGAEGDRLRETTAAAVALPEIAASVDKSMTATGRPKSRVARASATIASGSWMSASTKPMAPEAVDVMSARPCARTIGSLST